jgi:hypothetical protein
MKPTERYTITAYFETDRVPMIYFVFQKEVLDDELKQLKKMGFGPIEVKHEKIS